MISPARKLAYKILCQIESRNVFSDNALNSDAMERLEVRDRNLTTELVYGTLRWQGTLDFILAAASSRPWQDVDPHAKVLLRMSVCQMWQMDRIPEHALVNDAVELAKREPGRGVDKYVNGILRHLTRTHPWNSDFLQKAPPWIRASLPQWLWDRWRARYGEAAALDFALSLNRPPQPAFRCDGETVEKMPFEAVQSDIVPGAGIRISGVAGRESGVRYQDEASQLVPYLIGSVSGGSIWDACAAPGGKTAILCGSGNKAGRVVASDLSRERIARLRVLLKGTVASRLDLLVADASQPSPFRRGFDAVLADVPCSGLGTLRRNPEKKWRFNPEDLASLQKNQMTIIGSVSAAVQVGGSLLYSTCSTEPEENEQVIEWFLDTHPGFSLESPSSPPGIENWVGEDKMFRTFPGPRLWDGFFAARMLRRS